MVVEVFGLIINLIWEMLSIPIEFDGFSFTIWQFMLFVICAAVLINIIFGSVKSKKEE